MFLYDTRTGERVGRFVFESEAGTSNFPLAVTALADGSKVYVASERDAAVYVIDAKDPAAPRQSAVIATGAHPDALLLNQRRHAAVSSPTPTATRSRSLIRPSDKVIGTVLLRPEIARDLAGATPTGLALSPDEKTLYAALGDMNAVAVSRRVRAGPSGGGSTAGLCAGGLVSDGRRGDARREAAAGRQRQGRRAPASPTTFAVRRIEHSPLTLLEGTVDDRRRADATRAWRTDPAGAGECPASRRAYLHGENPLKEISLVSDKPQKIQHVIYIVKENRTYDQVLGDLPQGNGDPNRCIFGRDVTPNLHALAERFVLLDNFYDCGEVSGDGWTWSTQAQANEYVQRNVPYEYSGRGRSFDYEGQINSYPTGGFPADRPDGKPLSDDPALQGRRPSHPRRRRGAGRASLGPGSQGAGSPTATTASLLAAAQRTTRAWSSPTTGPRAPGCSPAATTWRASPTSTFAGSTSTTPTATPASAMRTRPRTTDFLRPAGRSASTTPPAGFRNGTASSSRCSKKDPAGGGGADVHDRPLRRRPHRGRQRRQAYAPSMVADNDYAVGQLVEAISKSPIWESTAIFIIEDDAQNGPDHVDAHRSTCYVISPWIKKGSIDHTFQNTVSVIRTMELLLGLGPMCQYDAASRAILDWDATPANNAPYEAVLPDEKLIGEITPGACRGKTEKSEPRADESRGSTANSTAQRPTQRRMERTGRASRRRWTSPMPTGPGRCAEPDYLENREGYGIRHAADAAPACSCDVGWDQGSSQTRGGWR